MSFTFRKICLLLESAHLIFRFLTQPEDVLDKLLVCFCHHHALYEYLLSIYRVPCTVLCAGIQQWMTDVLPTLRELTSTSKRAHCPGDRMHYPALVTGCIIPRPCTWGQDADFLSQLAPSLWFGLCLASDSTNHAIYHLRQAGLEIKP